MLLFLISQIIELLNRRGADFSYLHEVVKKDDRRRQLIGLIETVKKDVNQSSKLVGGLMRDGKREEAEKIKQGIKVKLILIESFN